MPGGDRTGPWAMGPRTGRGFGYCAGSDAPGYAAGWPDRQFFGRGRGYGRGMGFGRGAGPGRGYDRGVDFDRGGRYPPGPNQNIETTVPSSDEEKAYLENLVGDMERELDDIKKRLNELSKEE